MKSKNIKIKVITGVVMASMMASATVAFATDTTATTNNTKAQQGWVNRWDHKGDFKTVLNGLVTSGTITSDKETAIEAALSQKNSNKTGEYKNKFKTKLDALVTAGTITSDEETAIQTALTSAKGDFKTVLDSLVTSGTITSDKETAIETALAQKNSNKTGEYKNKFKTKLDALVTAGTITSDEETSIQTALTSAK